MNTSPERTKILQPDFISNLTKGVYVDYINNVFEFTITLQGSIQSNYNQKFSFKNCAFKRIEFYNVTFGSSIYFHDCEIEEDFIINNCVFNEDLRIHYVSSKWIKFWSNDFLSGIEILDFKKVDNLTLQIKKALGKVQVSQWHVNAIKAQDIQITFEQIKDCQIQLTKFVSKKVVIQFSHQFLGEPVAISDCKVDELSIYFLKNKAYNSARISRIESAKITFLSLHNDGWMTLSDIKNGAEKKDSLFTVQDSYLGNAELYHVNLDSFARVQIYNCHIQNIIPVNVKWNFNTEAYEGINREYQRELFRQLKNVCSRNMDKVNQLQFESMEMHFYSKQLTFKNNFQDWFILKSNQISNNHGSNWLRPIGWLLLFSFILYTIIICISKCSGNFDVGNFLAFIFPLHNISELLCSNPSNILHPDGVRFVDVLQKLISSYFIFQFLRSFRKYVN